MSGSFGSFEVGRRAGVSGLTPSESAPQNLGLVQGQEGNQGKAGRMGEASTVGGDVVAQGTEPKFLDRLKAVGEFLKGAFAPALSALVSVLKEALASIVDAALQRASQEVDKGVGDIVRKITKPQEKETPEVGEQPAEGLSEETSPVGTTPEELPGVPSAEEQAMEVSSGASSPESGKSRTSEI